MSMGFKGQLGIDTVNPTAKLFEFDTETLRKVGQIIDTSGIKGSRSHLSERTRTGNYDVSGSIEMFPSPEELNDLLEWIMGGTPTVGTPVGSTTFPLGEAVATRFVQVDRVAKVFTYAGCKVGRAVFSGSEGTAMKLALDLIGTTETPGAAASFPAITRSPTASFLFTDSVLTLVASARNVKEWSLTIDNALDVAFNNSLTASSIVASDRNVLFSCLNPYTSSETDLYEQTLLGSAGTLLLTNAGYSLEFTFGKLQFPPESPNVAGKGEIPLRLNGVARKTGATAELSTRLDLTP